MYTTINTTQLGIGQKVITRPHMKVDASLPPVFDMTKQMVGKTFKKTFFYNFWQVLSAPVE